MFLSSSWPGTVRGGESTMATGGGRQLTLFQCCISDSHDVDDDARTKRVRLSPGIDEDQS